MRRLLALGFLSLLPMAASAMDCSGSTVPQPLPVRPTGLPPVAAELPGTGAQLGAPAGVLARGSDEAQSVDRVLLRQRLAGCQAQAQASAASAIAPNGPGGAHRFDMSQNGRRMTADEFDAWMRARGVRVATGAPAAAPAAAETAPAR